MPPASSKPGGGAGLVGSGSDASDHWLRTSPSDDGSDLGFISSRTGVGTAVFDNAAEFGRTSQGWTKRLTF